MPQKEIPFKQIIASLLDDQKPFPPAYLQRFSDLSLSDLIEFKNAWPRVSVDRKGNLMEDLENLMDSETLVDFSDLGRYALADPIPTVRATAIRLLWEVQDNKLIPTLLSIMEKDSDEVVRATAATALGQYVYLGELEELPPAALSRVEDALLKKVNSSDAPLVRRRALESLGFSSRNEVPPLVRKFFNSVENDWVASALYAMGRSSDPQWEQDVLDSITSPEPDIQLEAVRAAGSLEFSSSRQPLLDLLENAAELDDEVRVAVLWSLSQVGGEDVRQTLEKLAEETEDEEELDLIEKAMENLEFNEGLDKLDLFDIIPEDKDEFTTVIDLEEESTADEDDSPQKSSKKTKPKK